MLTQTVSTTTAPRIVSLPDGDVGTAGPAIGGIVNVFHSDRRNGCGPWPFHASQVTDATAADATAYATRVAAYRATSQGVRHTNG